MKPVVELIQVIKLYKEGPQQVLAINGVSLALRNGEVVLIIGPSGSGKTTLLSMIGCILTPTAGDIRIDDNLVTGANLKHLPDIRKKYFGFVFQSFNLFPFLTARENIELILRLKKLLDDEIRHESEELLRKVDILDRADFYPRDLSGGQKQRVAIARALAGNPSVILADEPTANLDSHTGKDVLMLLKNAATHQNKAVAIVSHDPRAELFANTVIYLEDGKIKK